MQSRSIEVRFLTDTHFFHNPRYVNQFATLRVKDNLNCRLWLICPAVSGRTQQRISNVASNSNLAIVGRQHCLDRYINPTPGTVEISNGTIADTVEAIIGAVYLDGGLGAAKQVMERLGLL